MARTKRRSVPKRPVFIADYRTKVALGTSTVDTSVSDGQALAPESEIELATPTLRRGVRHAFPPAGSVAEGGHCDGYCYRIEFAAGRYAATYALIVTFLREQGYANVPIPRDVEELKAFRLPRKLRHQLSLFGEDGYVHNPLKILFPKPAGRRGALILELYDESATDHLLRFHRRKG